MASQPSDHHDDQPPHFLLFPLMSGGHMIPMVDFARLLARQGVVVSIVTTPHNAARFAPLIERDAAESALAIRLIELQFPSQEAGLPEGCENFDQLPSLGLGVNLFAATCLLREPAEELFVRLTPRPNCIISDVALPWTTQVAIKFNIPRLIFQAGSCFLMMCLNSLQYLPKVLESLNSETESFVLPRLPHQIEFTQSQLPMDPDPKLSNLGEQILAADKDSYGVVINTFEELEPEYVEEYRKLMNGKLWCIGPVSLCNKGKLDKFERGNKASIDVEQCLSWLDSHEPNSILYTCLGSMCNLIPAQLIELGLGLEASNKPFVWVIRETNRTKELEKWISEYGFEEKVKGRGLLIRGWAPQLLILSHRAVGGFLTHCGGNSSLEAVCAGVPVATWPLFADQFANEKLLVNVLRIGVKVGVQKMVYWGVEEEIGVLVKSESVREAIEELMGGEEREERRERAKKLAEMASKAIEEGGSSYLNMSLLIKEIMEQARGSEKPV